MLKGTFRSLRRARPIAITVLCATTVYLGFTTLMPSSSALADASASLTINTEPVGANVRIDGQAAGITPLSQDRIAPGEHRVRVSLAGYLENSRVVNLNQGQRETLNVRLTPSDAAIPDGAGTRLRSSESGGGGGGGAKWVLLTAAIGAVGVGTYMYLTKNGAPTAGAISASPSMALMGATVVRFTAAGASDPDSDPLTYAWTFGDGGSATGEAADHVFSAAGSFTVELKVSDGKKTTSATSQITVKSMAGRWRGQEGSYDIEFNLAQSGSSLNGTYSNAFPIYTGPGTVTSGTVSDPRSVVIKVAVPAGSWGITDLTYAGELSEDLNTLRVRNGSGTTDITLTRQ